jgi:hypothetical protein
MLQFIGVHRWPPGIPASSLPTCWPPSPTTKLSSARTTPGPPPHPRPSADDEPAPGRAGYPAGRATVDGSRVHDVPIDEGDAQLCPGSIATATPQTFTMAPHRRNSPASELTARPSQRSRTAPRPKSTRLEPVRHLRNADTGFSRTPSRLACRTRTVWQYRHVPSLSGPLPALPGASQVKLPSASTQLLRQPGGGVLSPPLGHTAPRGAPSHRQTTDHPARACRAGPHQPAAE